MSVVLSLSAFAMIVLGGLFSVAALIPFAMANDDPASGPLVRNGLLQLPAYVGLWVWLVLGVRRALRAAHEVSPGGGALAWLVYVGGVVVTMAAFFALARLDLVIAERRRGNR